MFIKIDRSFEGFFTSFAKAIIICTLIVSIGKSVTYYYFLYIVICFLLILIILAVYDYRRCRYSKKLVVSKGRSIKTKMDMPLKQVIRTESSLKQRSIGNIKESVFQKSWLSLSKDNLADMRKRHPMAGNNFYKQSCFSKPTKKEKEIYITVKEVS